MVHFTLPRSTGGLSGRRFGMALLAASVGVFGVAGFFALKDEASDVSLAPASHREIPVQVEVVRPRQISRSLILPGIVKPESRIELGFRVDGFLARFAVDEGERVEAGDVIAELDLADLERAVGLARAVLGRARAQRKEADSVLERQSRLLEARSTSLQNHDRARAAAEVARSGGRRAQLELEDAQDRLRDGTLLAPIAGYIERQLIDEHERVSVDSPVLILTAFDLVKVRAAVPDGSAARVRLGEPASVRAPAFPDRSFPGEISEIDVAADAETRTLPFEVTVPNPDLALRPEMVVEVEVGGEKTVRAHTVPLTSVLREIGREPFCFVVRERDGIERAERRLVVLGSVYRDRVVVSSGLRAGERLVVRGQHFLTAGDPVRIVEE